MLKSLDLFGFKSFADRTRFDFALGITCVVGPNGSGKSNVVDAIKWILGDQSPKSLRGKEMTDVIFNGSAGRKPSAFAEATLTFDNASHFLPIETQEVTIGRRLWRNGDSEYLINGAVSRLKDIKELFQGTGAATSAYSIIEQGRVDQILHANAAARRLVFEEAAGISRYKSRKVEAIKKLERVSQNLLRLTDIVQQLESQLTSTRNQAVKATKYREVADELKRVWLGLVADDFRHFTDRLQQQEKSLADTVQQLDGMAAAQQQLEQRLAGFDNELNAVEDRLRDEERRAATTREAMIACDSTMRHATTRLRELEAELIRIHRQRATTQSRLREAAAELTASRSELDQFDDTYLAQQSTVQALDEQISTVTSVISELRTRTDVRRRERAELVKQVAAAQQHMALLQAQNDTLLQTRRQLTGRSDEIAAEYSVCQAELDRRQAAVSHIVAAADALSDSFRKIRSRQKKLVTLQEETQKELAALREQRSAAQARLHMLEDLEQRQEGLSIGVKDILNRARMSNDPPWNSILGSVADLLDVDLDRAALLEVALGPKAQLIVLNDAALLVDYLTRSGVRIEGRVGFLSLDHHTETHEADDAELRAHPDILHRADELIAESSRSRQLASRLLSNTWIVTSLEAALRVARHWETLRFVTLQGEVLESDGTIFTGSLRGETTVLSRKSELRRLKTDLARLTQTIEASEQQLGDQAAQIQTIEVELAASAAQRDETAGRLSQLKSELDAQQQIADQLVRERQRISEQLAENAHQSAECDAGLARGRADLDELAQVQQAATHEIADFERRIMQQEETRQQLVHQHTEEKLKLAKKEERRAGLSKAVERLEDESRSRAEQADEVARRHKIMLEQRRAIELQLLQASSELAELYLHGERFHVQVDQLAQQRQLLRASRAEFADQETRQRQARRELSDRHHEQELRSREIRHQLEACGKRVEEEYGLTLDQVVDSGASAFRDLLASRGLLSLDANPCPPNGLQEPGTTEAEALREGKGESNCCDLHESSSAPSPSPSFWDVRSEIEEEVNRLRRKLKAMGSVNTDSLRDLDELEAKFQHFQAQLMDLTEAKNTLEEIIRKVNSESRRLFLESFEAIRKEFRELFRRLFGGGDGEIILEDPDDVLDCGIDIVARPPGKELRSISLLSGGEKTLTAVALLLAIFRSRPSPFCILDEVDAALDDANVERYASVIRDFHETTQFIMISHRKRTMVVADVIYGVTMEQSGVSKRMSVRFEDVGDNGEIKHTDNRSGPAQAA